MTDEGQNDVRFDQMDFRMPTRRRLEKGEVIEGTVVSVGENEVFVDVGTKAEATLDLKEVTDDKGEIQVKEGDKVQAFVVRVEPEVVLSRALARDHLNLESLEDARDLGIPVKGKVTGVNKGGFEVELGGARGFCPISQIELYFCEDPTVHVDQSYEFRVTEFKEEGRNIVVSRKAVLKEQQELEAEETMLQVCEGAELDGEVVRIQPFGVFVELGGGIQGMVHVSEISHARIEDPAEVLKVGEKVRVRVLRIQPDPKKPERQRIALSIKALLGDPWHEAMARIQEGDTVEGTVARLQPFGAFVTLAPGVDGLVHISEMADRRINQPSDVVSTGDKVTVKVLKVDIGQRRISLSMRADEEYSAGGTSTGSVVTAVVDRIKPFGLFVRIKGGGRNARGLIPAEDTGAKGKNVNLHLAFKEGQELQAMIVQQDPSTGKIRLSVTAIAEQEERKVYSDFVRSDSPAAGGASGFGTLGDALKKALKTD